MQTAFGEISVIDAHAHFFSRRFFATLARDLPDPPDDAELEARLSANIPFDIPDADPIRLGGRWVEEMDRQGVSRMVLIASVPGDEQSVAVAARAHPDRLVPYFMLDPRREDAVDRVERAFGEGGFRGVCLFPAMHHFFIWDASLRPIYEIVAAHRGIVFVHFGHLKVGVRDKLGLASRFDMRYANPVDLHGVAKSFPAVSFVAPHFGCGFFRELLLVADQCPNVYTDTSSSNGWMRLMPYPLDLRSVFAKALEVFGPDRILFGSDSSFFPRGWRRDVFETQVRVLEDLRVSGDAASAVLGGNLLRLLSR